VYSRSEKGLNESNIGVGSKFTAAVI